jgi:hypothetical protein
MTNKEQSPFGYRYSGSTCAIKLRFTKDKFAKSGIEPYGTHFVTKSGYVIFETELFTDSSAFRELNQLIASINKPTTE